MELIFLATGLLIGGAGMWFIARLYFQSKNGDDGHVQELQVEVKLVNEKLKSSKELAISIQEELRQKQEEIIRLNSENSTLEANQNNLRERMAEHQQELKQLQDKFGHEFRNLANEIFEEKTKKFTDQNKLSA